MFQGIKLNLRGFLPVKNVGNFSMIPEILRSFMNKYHGFVNVKSRSRFSEVEHGILPNAHHKW